MATRPATKFCAPFIPSMRAHRIVGTKVCHFNIRRFGQTEHQSGETKSLPQLPRTGELFHTELDGQNIRIRVTRQGHAPPPHLNGVFEFNADQVKDDGNSDGYGEFDEDDF
jgi:hypothetical protein